MSGSSDSARFAGRHTMAVINPRCRQGLFLIAVLLAGFRSTVHAQGDFENLVKAAAAAREAGNNEEAIRDYRRAVEIRSDWEEGWWYLGTLEYDAERFAAAIAPLTKVVELDPGFAPGWNFLGLCEFETHDYAKSLEHLQKGQSLGAGGDPEVARVAAYHLALLLNRKGDFPQAASLLTSTFADHAPADVRVALGLSLLRVPLLPQEVDPAHDALVHAAGETAAILARGELSSALESFRNLLQQYPNTPYLNYAFGKALASAGRSDEALREQQEEARISPASPLPYQEISSLELAFGHPREALRAAETALRLSPNSSAARRALAMSRQAAGEKARIEEPRTMVEMPEREARIVAIYALKPAAVARDIARDGVPQDDAHWRQAMLSYSAGNYPQAIAALTAYVAGQPNNGTAWAVMGLAEFETKDYNNARIHLLRGQELGVSGSAESVQLARYRLAILLNQNGEFDRASELLTSDAVTGSRAQEIQFALGMSLLRMAMLPEQVEPLKRDLVRTSGEINILLRQSKYDEAFPKLQSLLQQYPSTPFLHYVYGTALEALSEYDEAESQFRQELVISPKSELPYLRLASIALRARRPSDALAPAQRAVELATDSPEAHYLLGRSYLELSQQEKALKELERASKLAPGSPEVHFNLAKAYAKTGLPEKAEQEREIFAHINGLAEEQRARRGSQSYSGSHDATDFSVPRPDAGKAPDTH